MAPRHDPGEQDEAMEINHNAPVRVRGEIELFAPPEMVWDWLSRVDLWQDWHPEITNSRWLNRPGMNAEFKWRLRAVLDITSRIESWEERRELGFSGQVWSTTLRHVFRLDGDFRRTRVLSEASVEGSGCGFAPLRALISGQVARTNDLWLGALKTRLESEKFKGRDRS
ncbi:MAG: SRPBCC family protein [Dehalococcoidia bacterium]|nr:SRPBCC family protein [Dehalococcoidia bacterium]